MAITLPNTRQGLSDLLDQLREQGATDDELASAVKEVKALRPNVDFSKEAAIPPEPTLGAKIGERFEESRELVRRGAERGGVAGVFQQVGGLAGEVTAPVSVPIGEAVGAGVGAVQRGVEKVKEVTGLKTLNPFQPLVEVLISEGAKLAGSSLEEIQEKTGETIDRLGKFISELDPSIKDTLQAALNLSEVGGIAKGVRPAISAARRGALVAERGALAAGAVAAPIVRAGIRPLKALKAKIQEAKLPKVPALDKEVVQLEKQFGVELPAAAVSPPVLSKAEQILGEGLFGGEIKRKAQKAIDDFGKKVDEISAKAPARAELGEEILTKFREVEKERKKVFEDLYDLAEKIIKEGKEVLTVDAKLTTPFLDNLIKTKRLSAAASPAEVKFLETLSSKLKNIKLDVWRATLKDVGKKANFDKILDVTTDEKLFRSLWGKLKSDIDNSIGEQLSELKPVLKEANEKFAELQELRQRPFAKSIKILGKKGDVDTIAERLTKTKVSTNEVQEIYKTLGEDTTKKIQDRIIADIIESAKSPTEGFTPAGFSRQLKSIGDERLNALLPADQVRLLKNLDKVNQLIAKGTAVVRGSQTAPIQQIRGAVKGALALGTGGASLLAEFILARFFGSARGQAFLKGAKPEAVKALKETVQKIEK